jgi:hypothetical protein
VARIVNYLLSCCYVLPVSRKKLFEILCFSNKPLASRGT